VWRCRCLLKDPEERWSAADLLEHDFITSKAKVHILELELLEICESLKIFFQNNPQGQCLTPTAWVAKESSRGRRCAYAVQRPS
jgi:serine/threonine protein kinase